MGAPRNEKQADAMTPTFETDRLILRPLTLDDAPATQRLFPHWEVVRFLNRVVPWPYPDDGAFTFYRDVALPAVVRGENWIWAIEEKAGPEHLIGAINIRTGGSVESRGFWLGQPWHGRGYMTEAADPVTDFWFNTLDREHLQVVKAVDNVGSRRVSEKQSMRLVRIEDRDYVSGRLPTEIWEITREEWNARWAARPRPWRVLDCHP